MRSTSIGKAFGLLTMVWINKLLLISLLWGSSVEHYKRIKTAFVTHPYSSFESVSDDYMTRYSWLHCYYVKILQLRFEFLSVADVSCTEWQQYQYIS